MPTERQQFRKPSRRLFEQFDRWQADAGDPANVHRDRLLTDELASKVERHAKLVAAAAEQVPDTALVRDGELIGTPVGEIGVPNVRAARMGRRWY